ncbi:MAG: DNA primase [Endomicrobium sp.]|jgi:DNA primase|nr:DNA primase [Endomicrobium sp.]
MSIPEGLINKIKELNKIELVIGEYLPDLRQVGNNWITLCPFHNDTHPSFVVNSDKGIFKCFGCNVSGNIFNFIMLINNVSWFDAFKILSKQSGINLDELYGHNDNFIDGNAKILNILNKTATYYHNYLINNRYNETQNVIKYLYQRGLNDEIIHQFKLGFAPNNYFIRDKLLKDGYTINDLQKAGIVGKNDKKIYFEYMSRRIVFPIYNINGMVIAFGGRVFESNIKSKYINTPETLVYSKSKHLYGFFQALPSLLKNKHIIIVEGYMDVLVLHQFQIPNVVAILGTAFTREQAKLIARYSKNITLILDSDNAGIQTTHKSLEILLPLGVTCRVVQLPNNIDIDEYIIQYGIKEFSKLVNHNSITPIDFMIKKIYKEVSNNKMNISAEMKAQIIDKLISFISTTNNVIVSMEWISYIANYFDIDEKIIVNEYDRIKNGKHKQNLLNNHYIMQYKDKRVLMSLEENMLNLILNNRNYVKKLSCNVFNDTKCRKVFKLISIGFTEIEILNTLITQSDKKWFSELIFNKIQYSNIDQAFMIMLQDIKKNKIKEKMILMMKKLSLMTESNKDKEMLLEYTKLLKILKNPGKGKWKSII